MKVNLSLLLLVAFWLLSPKLIGQKRARVVSSVTPTILWKISGKDCRQPSYLLGTMHLSDADWLYSYPAIKSVLNNTQVILTEVYSTDTTKVRSAKTGHPLKALSLLSKQQYQTLDSFFVARVGEGITGNPEAENMTVSQLGDAILVTLTANTKGADGITKTMDMDLFNLYKQSGKKGDRLDRVATTEFDSTNIDHARQYLARSLNYSKGSNKPDWNLYHQADVQTHIAGYKNMKFDYKFDKSVKQEQPSAYFDSVPLAVRNRNWMHKITASISSQPTLIAVGLAHLFYKIGVIALLRERGYKVEPVMLRKQ